jgi:hypothetical protein
MSSVDPITRSVVQHRLSSIVAEMGEAMLRTSYSQILNSSRDFSLAICDVQSRLIAQADHIPVHVGALPWATRAVEERFSDVAPGDVILMNDPYHGGSHLPDVTAFVPVFAGGRRLLWTVVRAHQSDIGGATHGAYNPDATEIWQEGLRIPPIKLYEAGRLRDDILDMIALNVRNAHDFRGDLSAMIGAAHLGERRLQKLFAELGAATVEAAIEAVLDAAEAQARAVVATWKDGTFHGEAFLDDDGRGNDDIKIAAKVTKRGSDIEVDLSDSDPQVTSFMNSSHANMHAAVTMALAYLIDPDTPKNSGVLRLLKVVAKQGTIVWADPGRPVTMCTSHPSDEIVEAIVKALAGSCPRASRRRRLDRRRRLVLDRGVAHRRRAEIRQHRSRGSALSPAFPPSRVSRRFRRRRKTSRRTRRRARSRGRDRKAGTRQHRRRRHSLWRLRHDRRRERHPASLSPFVRRPAAARLAHQGDRHRDQARRLPRSTLGRWRRMGTAGQAYAGRARARSPAGPRRRRSGQSVFERSGTGSREENASKRKA